MSNQHLFLPHRLFRLAIIEHSLFFIQASSQYLFHAKSDQIFPQSIHLFLIFKNLLVLFLFKFRITFQKTINLGRKNWNWFDYVTGPIGSRMLFASEVDKFLKQISTQFTATINNFHTCLLYLVKNTLIRFIFYMVTFFMCLQQNQKWNGIKLFVRISHDIKCAHETIQGLYFSFCNFPMLIE